MINTAFIFRQKPKRLLVAGLFLTLFLFEILGISPVHAIESQTQFSMAPTFFPATHAAPRAYYIYSSRPMSLIRDSIHIMNIGKVQGTLDLYAADAATSPSSGTTFLAPQARRRDVGAWITLSRQHVTLGPGQSQDVPFTLLVPSQVRPGQHGGGIIGEVERPKASSAAQNRQITIQIRSLLALGVLVNLPGSLKEQLAATKISYDEENVFQRLLLGLSNTGTQLLHPSGNIQIMDQQGHLIESIPLQLDTILPQTEINYPIYIHHKALDAGLYFVHVDLAYEHAHRLDYRETILIPPSLLEGNKTISHAVSDLVLANSDFFRSITPWHYIIGSVLLILLLGALFLRKRAFELVARVRQRRG